jgi:hydrogenase/urease accessory protein HupE
MARIHHVKLLPLLGAFACLLALPRAASAHLVTTGLGPVYDGIGHLILTVEDLIPVIGLAMLAGLRGPRSGRSALFVLPLAWFAGGLLGLRAPQEVALPFQCISFLLIGILIASDLRLPTLAIVMLAIAMGLIHGYADGSAIKDAGVASGTLELIGLMVALFVLVALMSALVITLRWDWTRIVVRVAGSWIAAMGLLLLGWAIHTASGRT